jgi:hypothetical protein
MAVRIGHAPLIASVEADDPLDRGEIELQRPRRRVAHFICAGVRLSKPLTGGSTRGARTCRLPS